MASHKKTPVFLRIKASDNSVVGINPLHCSSFNIVENAKYKYQPTDKTKPVEERTANTIYFYFPQGTGLTYRVGLDITQAEFDYICATLLEFMYYNEAEFKARGIAMATAKMDEFKKLSLENESKLDTLTP